jgi:hypothetical protein
MGLAERRPRATVEGVLTERQAYDVMFLFLRDYWEEGKRSSDDIAILLGDLQRGFPWADEGSADPAMDAAWTRCVQRVLTGENPYQ